VLSGGVSSAGGVGADVADLAPAFLSDEPLRRGFSRRVGVVGAAPLVRVFSSSARRLARRSFSALGGHGLDGVELVARHQVHVGQGAFHALADQQFDLVPQAGQGAQRAAGDAGQIIKKAVLGLHDGSKVRNGES